MKKILIPIFILFLSSISFAQRIQCKVIDVIDGSTFTCLTDEKQPLKMSLYQVAAPELGQAYGLDAKRFLSDQLLNRNFQVKTHGQAPYKQTMVSLYSQGSDYLVDIGNSMIYEGYAWYRPLGEKNHQYQRSQKIAKRDKRGLWAGPNPVPPWEWIKQQRRK